MNNVASLCLIQSLWDIYCLRWCKEDFWSVAKGKGNKFLVWERGSWVSNLWSNNSLCYEHKFRKVGTKVIDTECQKHALVDLSHVVADHSASLHITYLVVLRTTLLDSIYAEPFKRLKHFFPASVVILNMNSSLILRATLHYSPVLGPWICERTCCTLSHVALCRFIVPSNFLGSLGPWPPVWSEWDGLRHFPPMRYSRFWWSQGPQALM